TWILRVKITLFTVNLFGGAKLFTVGCGEESLRLSLQTMNNFGATIRQKHGAKIWKPSPYFTDLVSGRSQTCHAAAHSNARDGRGILHHDNLHHSPEIALRSALKDLRLPGAVTGHRKM
ncbi:MAG TPA: hypothetical protein VFC44_25165, partial [Candidatus Saccharimonadales bacterium]|nr:hypothetical protein [Candidatus Saccharimonadales bacterium]